MTVEQRAVVWFVLASAGLLAGLATARPALVAVGAAFLVPLLFGLAARLPRLPGVTVWVSADRVIEGGRVELEVTLAASDPCPWIDVELRLSRPDPARENRLFIHVLFRPSHSSLLADDTWRQRCEQLFIELRAYLMGQNE